MMTPVLPEKYTAYVTETIRFIIDRFGERGPGSAGEAAAQAWLQEALGEYTDGPVRRDAFSLHPKAFMAFIPVACGCFLLAAALFFLRSGWGLAVGWGAIGVAFVVVVLEFGLYKRFLDPLFPKKESANVWGIREAKGAATRRIILSGHVDAAYEWRYHARSPLLLKAVIGYGVLAILAVVGAYAAATVCLITQGALPAWLALLGGAQLLGAPGFLLLAFFSNFKRVSPGANDNLTGAVGALALARYLHEEEIRFDNTEVLFLLTGSEEAGLRGAKAFIEQHQDLLNALPTFFFGLETFRDIDHMAVCHRDLNSLVKHDPGACALVRRAGEACGKALPYEAIYAGASDAAAFSQAGIAATTLEAMDPAPAPYYHTRHDTAENLDPACIALALAIAWKAVEAYAAEGLARPLR